jgi:hypothetical protein
VRGFKYTALRAYASDRMLGGEKHTPWVSGQRPGGGRRLRDHKTAVVVCGSEMPGPLKQRREEENRSK